MNATLKAEELALFVCSIVLFAMLPFAWWLYPALLLVPDVSMLGYLVNNRVGALLYNTAHHRATGIIAYGAGMVLGSPVLMLVGVILFGHSAFDRIAGYGLKYASGFRDTHLGVLPAPKHQTVTA
jgi:hypothetical protein